MSIGVPIKVLHEAEGHIVTCETNTGEVYRGKLIEAEDNMNCQVLPSHLHYTTLHAGGGNMHMDPPVGPFGLSTCTPLTVSNTSLWTRIVSD